jgi:hypothetical protein
VLGNNIISLVRYWCLKKGEKFQNKLHYILSQDTMLLLVHILGRTLDLISLPSHRLLIKLAILINNNEFSSFVKLF